MIAGMQGSRSRVDTERHMALVKCCRFPAFQAHESASYTWSTLFRFSRNNNSIINSIAKVYRARNPIEMKNSCIHTVFVTSLKPTNFPKPA